MITFCRCIACYRSEQAAGSLCDFAERAFKPPFRASLKKGGATMYAIIESGGKQYKVNEGDVIQVELLKEEAETQIEINRVLAVENENGLSFGRPYVEGATVTCQVLEHGKGKKIVILRYKPKKNQRVKRGHRQPFTKLRIEKITV
jgi:large subunit ribosomal protein L21